VKPLVLSLDRPPDQRLDASALIPDRLAGMTAADIARIELQTTRVRVIVGDVFRIRMGDPQQVRIEGGGDRLDRVGHGMTGGAIVVEGDVGAQAGRLMAGGSLTVEGSAGPWAGSGMTGGVVDIAASAGDRLGGPLAGETAGMRGGVIVVRGDVGERAGDRMRRGTIIVEGGAGPYAGSRMLAGTLIIRRRAGSFPGYLMTRGTIVLADGAEALPPTFVDCGVHDLVAQHLMAAFVATWSAKAARILGDPLRRLAGDMAVLGKGETFVRADR
jgi:formylmethanofuran dehydrogenase subunit C